MKKRRHKTTGKPGAKAGAEAVEITTEAERLGNIRARMNDLMDKGAEAVDAAEAAAAEFPLPPDDRMFEVSLDLPPRLWKFIDKMHPTQAHKDHLVRYLLSQANLTFKLNDPGQYQEIGEGPATSVPRDMFHEKAGF